MNTATLDEIRDLARQAHHGQVDKQGRDYFTAHLEPIAMALHKFGMHAEMAGYLHDILEDTAITEPDLTTAGVPHEVIRAVRSVSKRAGEPYEQLIRRAAQDPLGRLVKLADNAHNLASLDSLAQTDPEMASRLQAKYTAARERLRSVGSREDRGRMIEALEAMWARHPRSSHDPEYWPSMDDLEEMESLTAIRAEIKALHAYDGDATQTPTPQASAKGIEMNWTQASLQHYHDADSDVVNQYVERLAVLSPSEQAEAVETIARDVRARSLAVLDTSLAQCAASFVDDLYKFLSWTTAWSAEAERYVAAVWGSFFEVMHERGRWLRFVIENEFPDHLQRLTHLFPSAFGSAGLVFACPQTVAATLAEEDGKVAQGGAFTNSELGLWLAEGRVVAFRLVELAQARSRHWVYLEANYDAGSLDAVLGLPTPAGSVEVRRIEAPLPGSRVEVVEH